MLGTVPQLPDPQSRKASVRTVAATELDPIGDHARRQADRRGASEIGMSDAPACFWCARPFEPHRGGSRQTFCRVACRAAYHKATRQWCERAIAEARLTVQDLRNGAATAFTLPERGEPTLPLTNIERGDTAALDTRLRFLVEVEHHTVAGLVKLGFIRPEERDELGAIFAGMRRLGWLPHISRIS
jgi:hypothetical protein